MRKDLQDIRDQLYEICEEEATKLYRLAWRMQAHGCKPEHIKKCREEASFLHLTGYPERAITYNWTHFTYAFKY